MSKLILCLLLLLHYNCQYPDNVRIFEIPRNSLSYTGEFEVRKGETFALKFYSNPSTGYSWRFLNKEDVSDSLLLLTSKYEAPKTPKGMVGVGGYMYYYFKVVEITNETKTLKFNYSRGGNSKVNELPTHLIKITVN